MISRVGRPDRADGQTVRQAGTQSDSHRAVGRMRMAQRQGFNRTGEP